MTLNELVSDAYLAYKGKLTNVPAFGSEKYTRIVTIANRKQREWATDSNIDWPTRFEIRTVGSLATNQQTYDLDDDIIRPSDQITITASNGNKIYVSIIKPQVASRYSKACYITGFNPKQLTFVNTIDASVAGQVITIPCYTMPADLKTANQRVQPEHSRWLVYAVAAELARNDYAKDEQYPNLVGQANDLYAKMIEDAQNNGFGQPNGVVNLMPQSQSFDGFN